MYLLVLGIALLAMKWTEFGPVAVWSWWWVFTPFGLAVAWWAWADSSGYTARKAMQIEDAKKQARIDKNKENIGTLSKTRRK
jgi:small Trp-rich protein